MAQRISEWWLDSELRRANEMAAETPHLDARAHLAIDLADARREVKRLGDELSRADLITLESHEACCDENARQVGNANPEEAERARIDVERENAAELAAEAEGRACIICGNPNPGTRGIVYHMGESGGGDAFVCQGDWGQPPLHSATQIEEALKQRIRNAAFEEAAIVVEGLSAGEPVPQPIWGEIATAIRALKRD